MLLCGHFELALKASHHPLEKANYSKCISIEISSTFECWKPFYRHFTFLVVVFQP